MEGGLPVRTRRQVTNFMVPGGRRYQAATQVKGLSPEMSNVILPFLEVKSQGVCARIVLANVYRLL